MKNLNKWKNGAVPALLLHCSIGSVYCWSIFSQNIADCIGFSKSAVEWAFSIAIFFLGMSAAFAGRFVEKDIHKSSLLATVFFTVGLIGTAISIAIGTLFPGNVLFLILIYFFYGAIMGIGLGLGYLSPVKTLMLWFEDRKGLATGLAVAGFGAAKAIASPIMVWALQHISVVGLFLCMSVVYCIAMTFGHIFLYKPENWTEPQENKTSFKEVIKAAPIMTYISIWLMFFINITCGLSIISQEKQILSSVNCSLITISIIATLSAVANALGRIGYAALSDKFPKENKPSVFDLIFMTSMVFSFLCIDNNPGLIIPMIIIVNAGYGGGFSCIPTMLHSFYGMKNISAIHGVTLSAWAFAGLVGNQLSTFIYNKTGGYIALFAVIALLYFVADALRIILVRHKTNLNENIHIN